MLSSSKSDAKSEARFATRIDVLSERVDTLATTIATTASAMAKKDGELVALRRELEAREERIASLLNEARGGHGSELADLRKELEALSSTRSKQPGNKQLEQLGAKIDLIAQRVDTLATTVSTTAAGLAGREGELAVLRKKVEASGAGGGGAVGLDEALQRQLETLTANAFSTRSQLDAQAEELTALKTQLELSENDPRASENDAHSDELGAMLSTLRAQVEALDGLRAGATGASQEDIDRRAAETEAALEVVTGRIDELSTHVDSAMTNLSDKEHELAALHRHFTESSSRIGTIVEDLREALGAFPATGPAVVEELTSQIELAMGEIASVSDRIDRLEQNSSESADANAVEHLDGALESIRVKLDTAEKKREASAKEAKRVSTAVAEITARIDHIDKRVASVANDVARAKTLWPVALRSLEARLDDLTPRSAPPHPRDEAAVEPTGETTDDLLAGLRDSLQAMETVAAEMAKASETLGGDEGSSDDDAAHEEDDELPQAVAGGARVVQLRTPDS